MPPYLDWKTLKDARRSTRRRRAHVLTYLDDLDHDLTIVEYSAGFNNTNIQEAMQRLIVMERKISKIQVVIQKHLREEDRSLAVMTGGLKGGILVELASLGLMLMISFTFFTMAVHDYGK